MIEIIKKLFESLCTYHCRRVIAPGQHMRSGEGDGPDPGGRPVVATAVVRKRGHKNRPFYQDGKNLAGRPDADSARLGGVMSPARADYCEEPATKASRKDQAHPRYDLHTGEIPGKTDPERGKAFLDLSGRL